MESQSKVTIEQSRHTHLKTFKFKTMYILYLNFIYHLSQGIFEMGWEVKEEEK